MPRELILIIDSRAIISPPLPPCSLLLSSPSAVNGLLEISLLPLVLDRILSMVPPSIILNSDMVVTSPEEGGGGGRRDEVVVAAAADDDDDDDDDDDTDDEFIVPGVIEGTWERERERACDDRTRMFLPSPLPPPSDVSFAFSRVFPSTGKVG